MKLTKEIAARFREVLLDGKWVLGTNYKDQLSDINWEQATTKIGTFNSIAALTFHIDYYIAGILHVLEGGSLEIRDKYSFDLPSIQSKKDWKELKYKLLNDAEKFANSLELMNDSKLEEIFVDKKYGSYKRNINAMIEHSYYHLGQIAIIKKMLQEQE
jgi:uncharacterized damage-inducible protein DinB